MVVLVSGATGFLGSQLIQRLVLEGEEVIAVARNSISSKVAVHPRIKWIIKDIAQDGFDLGDEVKPDCVIHLAGATLGAGSEEDVFLDANERTTVKLLQAVAHHTKRFIYASSQVVYGDVNHLKVTEEFPLQPTSSAYACSKVNSENWLQWFQQRYGGQYLALRFCGFIDGGGLVDYVIEKALREDDIELFSQGRVQRDYLPSSAAIDVLISALKYQGPPGFLPINIGSGQIVSSYELATVVCNELHSASQIQLITTPSPQRDFVFSIARATELFGFRPSKLIDSVRSYARFKGTLQ